MSLSKEDIIAVQDAMVETIAPMFETIGLRFDEVDKRFDGVDKRLDGMDSRLNKLETTQKSHTNKLQSLQESVDLTNRKLDSLIGRVDAIEADLASEAGVTLPKQS